MYPLVYPLVYLVVATVAATLATRTWQVDRGDPARLGLLLLGWALALSHAAFALSFLPGLLPIRLIWLAAGSCIPALAFWTLDRAFADDLREQPPPAGLLRLSAATALGVPGLLLLALAAWRWPGLRPLVEPGFTLLAGSGFVAVGFRLRRAWEQALHQATRARLALLGGVMLAGAVAGLSEEAGRWASPPRLPTAEALQGPVPPLSALLGALAMVLLDHTVRRGRLLDLADLGTRGARLMALAALLTAMLLVGGVVPLEVHLLYRAGLVGLLFLLTAEAANAPLQWALKRAVNLRAHRLELTLAELRPRLSAAKDTERLVEDLLDGLLATGRVTRASVYLRDPGSQVFRLAAARPREEAPSLTNLVAHAFVDGLEGGRRAWQRAELIRQAPFSPRSSEALSLLDTLGADLTWAIARGDEVLGFVNVSDEAWSDGYSLDEIRQLREVGDHLAALLVNIRGFQALEQQHRLAALGQLAAGMAHEIRNPLAGVKGAAQLLQESEPAEGEAMLQVIVDEVDRLDRVVSQFLDYARPLRLDPRPTRVAPLLDHALALVQASEPAAGRSWIRQDEHPEVVLPVDAAALVQVLLNLLRNAAQATEPSSGKVSLRSRLRSDGFQVWFEVEVQDDGPGVKPADLEQLFLPFFTTRREGTGLGLAISQRLVQAHGGQLLCFSPPGQGATFVVRLPSPEEENASSPFRASAG